MSELDLGETSAPRAAFFDLERTLTRDAVEQVAALAMYRAGRLSKRAVAKVMWVYGWYNLGVLGDFEALKRSGAQVLAGRNAADDLTAAEALFQERLQHGIFPEARALCADLKRKGVRLVMVSSTYRFLAEPFARALGFDEVHAVELLTDEGRWTGHIHGPVIHQHAKAEVVRQVAKRDRLSLEFSFAFGDSVNDAAMLAAVGRPYAVNPARGLRSLAGSRGWPVLEWR